MSPTTAKALLVSIGAIGGALGGFYAMEVIKTRQKVFSLSILSLHPV
jgi:uncharacterized membrane protein YsdA (DUF1294 family)